MFIIVVLNFYKLKYEDCKKCTFWKGQFHFRFEAPKLDESWDIFSTYVQLFGRDLWHLFKNRDRKYYRHETYYHDVLWAGPERRNRSAEMIYLQQRQNITRVPKTRVVKWWQHWINKEANSHDWSNMTENR